MAMFPFYQWGTIAAIPNATAWDRIIFRIEHVRILGVLPRIAIVYVFAALLTLKTTLKQQILIIAALLFGYWWAMTLIPVPGENAIGALLLNTHDRNLAAYLDRLILGTNHTWIGSVTFDPEGPMSTIPAIATAVLGVIAGRWIRDEGKAVARAHQRALRGGLYWNDARAHVELGVSDQQESLDQLLRDLYRRNGVRWSGDHHVGRRLPQREVVDQAVRDLRRESDRGVRGVGRDGGG